jgi:beta-carotene 3-hydroxylase
MALEGGINYLFFIGLGITAYGFSYFMIHDVLIHQRFKWFRTQKQTLLVYESPQRYNKHLGKEHGVWWYVVLYLFKYYKIYWLPFL